MSEKPILFNTDMVKEILEDRKTQTRRFIKGRFDVCFASDGTILDIQKKDENDRHVGTINPPYQAGDILWVRETWCNLYNEDKESGYESKCYYAADGMPPFDEYNYEGEECPRPFPKWKPSIHMPREAARLFLKVTNVRVERLQDISEEDAKAEGADKAYYIRDTVYHGFKDKDTYRDGFRELWDSCYEYPKTWMANPWVWVIEFERLKEYKG